MLCVKSQWAEAGKSIRTGKSLSIVFLFGDFFLPRCPEVEVGRRVRERGIMTLTTEVPSKKNRHGALGWFPVS